MHLVDVKARFGGRIIADPPLGLLRRRCAKDEDAEDAGIVTEWPRDDCLTGIEQLHDVPEVLLINLVDLCGLCVTPLGTLLNYGHMELDRFGFGRFLLLRCRHQGCN